MAAWLVGAAVLPASGLRLRGTGPGWAWTRGPAVLPREEPLLPRLETFLGSMAELYWRLRGGGCDPGRDGWRGCVLGPACTLLCGGLESCRWITGPFLLALGPRGVSVYVSVSTGLLRARGPEGSGGLEDYVEAARLLAEAAEAFWPGERAELERRALDLLGSLRSRGELVDADAVAARETRVALDPRGKGAWHGLLYSIPRLDYYGLHQGISGRGPAAPRILIAYLAACREPPPRDVKSLHSIGSKRAPATLQVAPIEHLQEAVEEAAGGEGSIVISHMPVDVQGIKGARVVHPLPPPPPLDHPRMVYASTRARRAWTYTTPPAPSLWPGTVLLDPLDPDPPVGRCPCRYTLTPRAAECLLEALAERLGEVFEGLVV